ncbi:MAG: tRNA dihydrouridine synthase DusB [Pseudomonadota bacterium]
MPDFSSIDLSHPLEIDGIKLRNRVFLAPMSGVSDVPFRKLAWQFGAGMVVSEMVASQALVEGEEEMLLKVQASDATLHVVQIAGREAKWMALAAEMAQNHGAQIIDLNMGCPARRVTTGYSGSALMRDLDHALTLIDAVVNVAEVPVTLKMRLGWDHDSINAPQLARRAENAGIKMITVHGRTRCQFYKGKADWETIRFVKEEIHIPLVVNGDIGNLADAKSALAKSQADAVMVGRATYGAPWLLGKIANPKDSPNPLNADYVRAHHEMMLSFYGAKSGIRQARKHLGWYLNTLAPMDQSEDLKRRMMTSENPKEVHQLIDKVFRNGIHGYSAIKSAA